jgi:hypothetical protein
LAPQQQPDFGGIYLEIKSNIGGAQETHMSSSVKPKPWITIEAVTKKKSNVSCFRLPAGLREEVSHLSNLGEKGSDQNIWRRPAWIALFPCGATASCLLAGLDSLPVSFPNLPFCDLPSLFSAFPTSMPYRIRAGPNPNFS